MRIMECSIQNFGKLSSVKYKFEKGLNSVCAPNGNGKSTLAAFIFAMFYGLSDTKKQSLDENDRKKYTPWGGGIFGGSLTFEANEKTYRTERTFGKKASDDTFLLYDAKTGALCGDFTEALGEELFGIDEDGFLRTVFLSEKSLDEKNVNKSIGAKLSGAVGVSADMGELDNALKILDEKRKLYYKKGGSGIIGDIKVRRCETELKLTELSDVDGKIERTRARISEIEKEILSETEKQAKLEEARIALEKDRRICAYKEEYENMKKTLAADEEKYADLCEFFKNGKPTYEEIEDARQKNIEFEKAQREIPETSNQAELRELSEFFSSGVSAEETERIFNLASRLEVEESNEKVIVPSEFSLRIPTQDELSREEMALQKAMSKKSLRPLGGVLLTAGLMIFALSLFPVLSGFIPVILMGLGVISVITSIAFLSDSGKKRVEKARKRAERFILSISKEHLNGDSLDIIRIFKERLSEYEESKKRGDNRERRILDTQAALREIYDYLAKFPSPSAKTLLGAISEIREKHRRFEVLTLAEKSIKDSNLKRKREASAEMERVTRFLARYNTLSGRPFDEIRDALFKMDTLSSAIKKRRAEIEDFAKRNGIFFEEARESKMTEAEISDAQRRAQSKIFDLNAEKIRLESTLAGYSLQLEEKSALTSERERLNDEEKRYESNLGIIQKTAKYLTDAHKSITGKYLDKTKRGFDEYLSSMGFTGGDFVIDTDFVITKYEGATARKTESYSKGTRALFALALRLALTDALYDKEKPFIILDDPFMSFDDKTISETKSALEALSKTKQIIYFTCSRSRAL